MSFLVKQGKQILQAPVGNRWHGWDADAHGLLENAGDNQSDAMAAGGFSEGKTVGFWSFRCLCMGDAHPHMLPQTPPHPRNSQALLPCAQCPLPGDKKSLVSLKSGKQNGVQAVLSVLRDALAVSPTPQATKRVLLAPAINPRLVSLLPPACLGPFTGTRGTWGAQKLSWGDSCLPKGGASLRFPQRHRGRTARGSATEAASWLCHGFLDGCGVSSSVLGIANPCWGR